MAGKPSSKRVKALALSRLNSVNLNATDPLFLNERRAFIDKFIKCEVVCKAFVEKYKQLQKTDEKGREIKLLLDMRIIPSAFDRFDFHIDKHVLTPVFGGEKGKGHKSCKKIRDGIIHSLNISDLQELHDRYDILIMQMDRFLSYFE